MVELVAPLEGIKVLDLGRIIAGPGAAAALGDLGAEVIKVEPLQGEPARSTGATFGDSILHAFNRNKRSIAIDLSDPRGKQAMRDLIESADILIHNMRPGAMEGLGFGAEQLLSEKPSLIYASVSGFGARSTRQQRACFDVIAQAESGMMSVTGEAGGQPLKVGFTVVDAATTAVMAQAILAALVRRMRTGEGAVISISLLQVAMYLQSQPWSAYLRHGEEPVRMGNQQPDVAPAADLIATKDGVIILSAYIEDHYRKLCAALGREDLASDARYATNAERVRNREQLVIDLSNACSHLTSEECVDLLVDAGIAVGAIRDYPDVRTSPDVIANEIIVETDEYDGRKGASVRAPYDMSNWKPKPGRAPYLGEHSAQILDELGWSSDKIAELIDNNVVATASRT